MATKNFTQFNTATPLLTSDYVVGYNAAGTAEIKTQVKDIVDLVGETDSQTLSFNETTKDLSITSGNTVSLSAFPSLSAGKLSTDILPEYIEATIIPRAGNFEEINTPSLDEIVILKTDFNIGGGSGITIPRREVKIGDGLTQGGILTTTTQIGLLPTVTLSAENNDMLCLSAVRLQKDSLYRIEAYLLFTILSGTPTDPLFKSIYLRSGLFTTQPVFNGDTMGYINWSFEAPVTFPVDASAFYLIWNDMENYDPFGGPLRGKLTAYVIPNTNINNLGMRITNDPFNNPNTLLRLEGASNAGVSGIVGSHIYVTSI